MGLFSPRNRFSSLCPDVKNAFCIYAKDDLRGVKSGRGEFAKCKSMIQVKI